MSGRVFVVCLDTRVDMYVDHVGTCRYTTNRIHWSFVEVIWYERHLNALLHALGIEISCYEFVTTNIVY